MKWIVVILLMLNVAAYLLGLKANPDAQQIASAGQIETINAAAMSVVKPTRETQQVVKESEAVALEEEGLAQLRVDKRGQVLMAPTESRQTKVENASADNKPVSAPVIVANNLAEPEILTEPEPKTVKVAKVTTPEPVSPAQEAARVAQACYRLGPFVDQNSLAAARRKLESGGIKYTVDERGAQKNIKAVRVYLGAYSDTAALEDEKKRLEKMKIEHFVIRLNGEPLIQLGYFSEPERARTYQKTLKSRGVEAKTDTIYHDVTIESWLDLQLASKDMIKSLALPRSVKTKEQACR